MVASVNLNFDRIQLTAAKRLGDLNWRHGRIHDLRSTFATRAAAAGVHMKELQQHMGHSSILTTGQFYTAVEESAADRLRAAFTGTG